MTDETISWHDRYANDPVAFIRDILGISLSPSQAAIVRVVRDIQRTNAERELDREIGLTP